MTTAAKAPLAIRLWVWWARHVLRFNNGTVHYVDGKALGVTASAVRYRWLHRDALSIHACGWQEPVQLTASMQFCARCAAEIKPR